MQKYGSWSTCSDEGRWINAFGLRRIDRLAQAMIQTTHTCRKCGSSDIVKNGHSASGSQQYHCKNCGAYLVLDPDSNEYSEDEKQRIPQAYRERGSKSAISRIVGVIRNTLFRRLQKGTPSRPASRSGPAARRGRCPRTRRVLDLRPPAVEQTLALGRALATYPVDRYFRDRRSFCENLRSALGKDSIGIPRKTELQ
ncbi:transposase-like protein [Salinibacter ruber]|nr:transposase-like protein [Salinibacter ruber]